MLGEFVRDSAAECRPGGQTARLGATASLPGASVGDGRPIDATPTVTHDFAANRGGRSIETLADTAEGLAEGELARKPLHARWG